MPMDQAFYKFPDSCPDGGSVGGKGKPIPTIGIYFFADKLDGRDPLWPTC